MFFIGAFLSYAFFLGATPPKEPIDELNEEPNEDPKLGFCETKLLKDC
jgi:hypothetical protein